MEQNQQYFLYNRGKYRVGD